MDARYYDPNLIWTLARAACEADIKAQGHHPSTMTTHDPRIHIYADGVEGAHLLIRGRLYHDEDTADDHWCNTDDTLADHADGLREVTLRYGQLNRAFGSYADFIAWIKK